MLESSTPWLPAHNCSSRPPTRARQFANNTATSFTYGCDVIVDDITYLMNHLPGYVMPSMNSVTASGGLYFSSAGMRKFDRGTAGTWEGDFTNAAPVAPPVDRKGGFLHGSGQTTSTCDHPARRRAYDTFGPIL